jgi:hypothetical protein
MSSGPYKKTMNEKKFHPHNFFLYLGKELENIYMIYYYEWVSAMSNRPCKNNDRNECLPGTCQPFATCHSSCPGSSKIAL